MYKEPIAQKYLDLIKANRPEIKGFFNGVIAKIPKSMLPAVMIEIETTEIDKFSNTEDYHKVNLILTYIHDTQQSYEESALIDTGINKVKEVLIGRGTDYKLQAKSILNILRSNLSIDSANQLETSVGSVMVNTPNDLALDRRSQEWSAEGTIRFQAHFVQDRN